MNFIKVNMPSTPLRCLTPCDTSVSTLNDRLFSNKRANVSVHDCGTIGKLFGITSKTLKNLY